MPDAPVEKAKRHLSRARHPVVLTGAGVSAESGVPTFRGPDGLWKSFKPEELATPEAFEANPMLVWEWYSWRRRKIASVAPNPAHYALAELEKRNKSFTLITQNVDGLHSLAGSRSILELHGSIWRVRCMRCALETENRDLGLPELPRCSCGGLLRPGVVWFGEMLPEGVLEKAFEAASDADFMMVIGTSGVVQPAAALAIRAKNEGAFLVEVNTDETPLSLYMDVRLAAKAGQVLPLLV